MKKTQNVKTTLASNFYREMSCGYEAIYPRTSNGCKTHSTGTVLTLTHGHNTYNWGKTMEKIKTETGDAIATGGWRRCLPSSHSAVHHLPRHAETKRGSRSSPRSFLRFYQKKLRISKTRSLVSWPPELKGFLFT